MFPTLPTCPSPLRFLLATSRILTAAALLVLSPLVMAQAQRHVFSEGDQSLTVELPLGSSPRYGFHPVKITATNGGTDTVAWDISISEMGMNERSVNSRGHRERIAVPPQRTAERELMVGMGRRDQHSWSYRQVEVILPSGMKQSWNPTNGSGSTNMAGVPVPVLISNRAGTITSGIPSSNDDFHGRMDAASAPGDWRGYAAYSAVVLTADDWQSMSVAARTALGDWARMGGHLQFVDELPTDAPATDVPGKSARGMGGVHGPSTMIGDGRRAFQNLPGTVDAKMSEHPATEAVRTGEHSLIQNWLADKQPDLLRERFTIWPMVLVLVVFFVVMAPINLFVLSPSRRRHRLFRTIPVISIAACVLLALAVGLGDGVGGRGQRLVWIESRPGSENRQFITQWQASRCGALIGTSFTVPDAAFLAPLRDPGGSVTLRVEGDRLEAGGGWFTSRATQAQFLQAARPGRGRIEWSAKNADAPSAVSTFDFPLRDVFAVRDDGTYWHAPVMRQGETTTLHRVELKQVNDSINAAIRNLPQEADIRNMAHRTGHFIAFTDAPPAIPSLRSVRWKDTGIVTGAIATP